jgi:hypothetical protein
MKKPELLDLRPTQFVLGMKEIEAKVKKINESSTKELAKYCDEHVIPVVLGPENQVYMIDHHHFARACWETDTANYDVEVIKDLSDLKPRKFWNFMIQNGWTYLHDQFGLGPHTPRALPSDIRCMADDPYRSLAWAVLDEGGIKKMKEPFFEFKWAAYFRHNLDIILHSKSDFKDAIKEAMKLTLKPEAKHLPGFVGAKK